MLRRKHVTRAALFGAATFVAASAVILWYAASDDLPRSTSTALLEAIMPAHDIQEVHSAHVDALPAHAYAAILAVTPGETALARPFLWIRTLPGRLRGAGPIDASVWNKPFLSVPDAAILGRVADTEIVVGLIGDFWKLRGGNVSPYRAATSSWRFNAPGFAVSTLSFHIDAERSGCRVTTITRVRTTDPESRRAFRRYWRVIGTGSGVLRCTWLRAVKTRAERLEAEIRLVPLSRCRKIVRSSGFRSCILPPATHSTASASWRSGGCGWAFRSHASSPASRAERAPRADASDAEEGGDEARRGQRPPAAGAVRHLRRALQPCFILPHQAMCLKTRELVAENLVLRVGDFGPACERRARPPLELERLTMKHPRAIRQGVSGFDFASLDGQPERSRTDPEDASGFIQIHPPFRGPSIAIVASDVVVAAERDHPFSSPVIATPGEEPIPIQDVRQQIVRTNPRQHAYRIDDVLRRVRGTLPASSSRQSQFGLNRAFPVNDQNDLTGIGIDINDDFMNECSNEAFLQSDIRVRIPPDGLEVRCQILKFVSSWDHGLTATANVSIDALLDLADALQGDIPASLQLVGH